MSWIKPCDYCQKQGLETVPFDIGRGFYFRFCQPCRKYFICLSDEQAQQVITRINKRLTRLIEPPSNPSLSVCRDCYVQGTVHLMDTKCKEG